MKAAQEVTGKRTRNFQITERLKTVCDETRIMLHSHRADLEDFLKYHPDWPEAAEMRGKISQWSR